MLHLPSASRPDPSAGSSNASPGIRLFTLLTALLLAALAACGTPEVGPPEPPDPLTPEQAARATQVGGPAAGALAEELVGRLAQAIDEEGLAGAVDFCADAAMPLTREVQERTDPPLALKRATLRWRNPDNAADEWEERVLHYLAALEEADPDGVPAELTARGPGESLRYYRVLRTAPMCLNCHGAVESIEPEVRQLLSERYPDDRATGYEAGELRGVIRVEVPQG
ncbi:MAG: DUF3365 domain-containing protein [Gemmatimonadota bacterium]